MLDSLLLLPPCALVTLDDLVVKQHDFDVS